MADVIHLLFLHFLRTKVEAIWLERQNNEVDTMDLYVELWGKHETANESFQAIADRIVALSQNTSPTDTVTRNKMRELRHEIEQYLEIRERENP